MFYMFDSEKSFLKYLDPNSKYESNMKEKKLIRYYGIATIRITLGFSKNCRIICIDLHILATGYRNHQPVHFLHSCCTEPVQYVCDQLSDLPQPLEPNGQQ